MTLNAHAREPHRGESTPTAWRTTKQTPLTLQNDASNLPGCGAVTFFPEVPLREFKVGEKVVYPAHGVGVIEDVQARSLSGLEQKFYTLRIIDTEMKIMIPTAKAESVGLRRVIGKDMVSKVYKVLREKRVRVDQATWNRRYREYTEKIKTGSVLEIAGVLRDLFMLKGDKELSFGERKMLDTARNLLVKELAIAKSHSEEKIMEELKTIFGH